MVPLRAASTPSWVVTDWPNHGALPLETQVKLFAVSSESSSGRVTLQLNNGCTITLQPNQAVTIDEKMTCRALVAAVEPVGTATGLGLGRFVAAGSPAAGAFAVTGLVLAGYVVHRAFDGKKEDDKGKGKDQDLSGR